jgi:hypothetical protein
MWPNGRHERLYREVAVEDRDVTLGEVERSLKKAVAALRDAEIPFLLGGGLASWARGGPMTRHDLDFVVKPEDAERALEALVDAGLRPERAPEEWLFKVWDGDVGIDLIFEPKGLSITDEVIERGDELPVFAISMRVMAIEDVLATKLLALNEHALDYEGPLQIARSLREQIDWSAVRRQTSESPYARAFFALLGELGIGDQGEAAAEGGASVRVIGTPDTGTAAER